MSSWLYSISINKITDLYRKKKTDNLEDYFYANEDGDFEIKDILLLDDSQSSELAIYKDVFWKVLMEALEEQPENQIRYLKTMKYANQIQEGGKKTIFLLILKF